MSSELYRMHALVHLFLLDMVDGFLPFALSQLLHSGF